MDAPALRRRRVLGQALALAGTWAVASPLCNATAVQPATGWLSPRPELPPLRVKGADGRQHRLPELLAGRVTALQLMFTGCGSICPTQGALFAALASRLRARDAQLLSISIDVLGDTPASLLAWQARFGHHPAWATAVADAADVDQLASFVKGASARPGTHTAQVFVFDRQARLCHRTADAPAIAEVEALLAQVA